jgi:hypothetical protein
MGAYEGMSDCRQRTTNVSLRTSGGLTDNTWLLTLGDNSFEFLERCIGAADGTLVPVALHPHTANQEAYRYIVLRLIDH